MSKDRPSATWFIADPAWESLDAALEFRKEFMTKKRMLDLVDEIFDQLDHLVRYPGSGAYEASLAHLGQGHRHWVVGHFKIIYRMVEDVIWVSDIFDSRQEPSRIKP